MNHASPLWARFLAWPNWLAAFRKARRGKRDRAAVSRFDDRQEQELFRLRDALAADSYSPGPFTTHRITRPKPRLISAAPFRDRVVHHALLNVLQPDWDRRFHPHSFACRPGKGQHAAANHLQALMRRHRWFVACDVRQFFPSIDHEILKRQIRRFVSDARIVAVLDTIIDGSNEQDPVHEYFPRDHLFTPFERRRGLPIGNLTSQWLANLYLDSLDQLVTRRLGIGGYVRYADDFVLLDNDRGKLAEVLAAARQHLNGLRLKIHDARLHPRRSCDGVTYVGFRIWPTHRFLTREAIQRVRRRLRWMHREHTADRLGMDIVKQRIASWLGHACQAQSAGLIAKFADEWRQGFKPAQPVSPPPPPESSQSL